MYRKRNLASQCKFRANILDKLLRNKKYAVYDRHHEGETITFEKAISIACKKEAGWKNVLTSGYIGGRQNFLQYNKFFVEYKNSFKLIFFQNQ